MLNRKGTIFLVIIIQFNIKIVTEDSYTTQECDQLSMLL